MSAINTHIIVEAAVKANGKWIELTEHITKFSHILSNVEASSASITLNSEHMNYKLDDFQYLANGQTIVFRYGYLNQEGLIEEYNLSQAMSKRYVAVIGDINYQYGSQGSKFILKLISKGYLTKKVVTQKIWKDVTASDIARQVARMHNLRPFIDETSFVYAAFPQGNMSNYDLLRRLAQMEAGFIFFIRSNELHFKKVGTYKKPIYRIDVRGAIVTDLNLVWQEIEEAKKMGSLFSDEEGKFSSRESLQTIKTVGETLLDAGKNLIVDDNGLFSGNLFTQTKETRTEEIVEGSVSSSGGKKTQKKKEDPKKSDDAEDKGMIAKMADDVLDFVDNSVNGLFTIGEKVVTQIENSTQKQVATLTDMLKSTRRELTADVTLVGVPYLINDEKLILNNIHSRFEGSYYIEEVTHRIEESYMTSLRLNKHGIRRLDEDEPRKKNSGGDDTPTKVNEEERILTDAENSLIVNDNGEFKGNYRKETTNTIVEESLGDAEK